MHSALFKCAKMSYQKGQEVLRCQPFTYVIYSNYREIVCDFCLKYSKNIVALQNNQDFLLKKCSACKKVYYCGILCQKKAWKLHHQDECAYLRKIPAKILSNHGWQIIRTLLKLQKNNKNDLGTLLPNGKTRFYEDLMSHQKEIVMDPRAMETFNSIFLLLQFSLGQDKVVCRYLIYVYFLWSDTIR